MNISLHRLTRFMLLGLLTMGLLLACTSMNRMPVVNQRFKTNNCRVVQHAMGKTCIPNNLKRVITVSRILLSNALALGVEPIGSSVWGIEELRTFLSNKSFLGEQVEEITSVGQLRSVSLEKILSLEPDLILAWKPAVEAVYPLLSQISPTVVISFNYLIENWKEVFNITAQILNREAEAQQVWNRYNQRIKDLKTAIGDRYKDKTFSIAGIYNDGRRVYIYTRNSFVGSIFEELGLQRPSVQDVSVDDGIIDEISEEKLELLDGDILFIMSSKFGHTESYEIIKQKPLWQKLNSVQNGRVYLVDNFAWATESPLAADAVFDDLYKYLVNAP